MLLHRIFIQTHSPLEKVRQAAGPDASARLRHPNSTMLVRRMSTDCRALVLTGDNRRTTRAVARQVGMDDVIAEVLPAGKVDQIKQLQGRARLWRWWGTA